MGQLLAELSRQYDRIVIDTPPVAAVSDALVLLPLVDGVVFVVRCSKLRREIAARTIQKLRECGGEILGVVMNNIDLEKHGYYYYPFGYGYSQGVAADASFVR
jgi:polysaccharide biosynthesis transport protein